MFNHMQGLHFGKGEQFIKIGKGNHQEKIFFFRNTRLGLYFLLDIFEYKNS